MAQEGKEVWGTTQHSHKYMDGCYRLFEMYFILGMRSHLLHFYS